MNREIKFRGKSLEDGEWIYGYYGYKELTDEHFIIVPTFDNHSSYRPQYFMDNLVDGESVGQHIGLFDKNNVGIYDGDILSCTNEKNSNSKWVSVVRFKDGSFVSVNIESDLYSHFDDWRYPDVKFEVIGNIYENKPLLNE